MVLSRIPVPGRTVALLSVLAFLAAACIQTQVSTVIQVVPVGPGGSPNHEYIAAAEGAPEAQAFLAQFPQAEVLVDDSGNLAVDFRHNKHLPTRTTESWEGIRLRVFLDPEDLEPVDAFIQCKNDDGENQFIYTELLEYIEQYSLNQRCP
jgi:hypothetical protein